MQHLQRSTRVKHDKCIDNKTLIIRERQVDNLVAHFAQPIRQKLYSVRRQVLLVGATNKKKGTNILTEKLIRQKIA